MHFYYYILPLLATLSSLCSCTGNISNQKNKNVASIINNDSLPNPVKDLVESIASSDSVTFASLVDYPLTRPYPLHNITDSKEMEGYFHILVDDSLRNVVANSPAADWQDFGWRGWSLKDGEYVWIDGLVYDIPYLSLHEKQIRDSLVSEDLKSLKPDLQKNWNPVCCLKSEKTGTIYRIDQNTQAGVAIDKSYRLVAYSKGTALNSTPSFIYFGQRLVDGSAATITYAFNAPAGITISYCADIPDDSLPSLVFTSSSGDEHELEVKPVYWLDLLPHPSGDKTKE